MIFYCAEKLTKNECLSRKMRGETWRHVRVCLQHISSLEN